MKSPVWTSERLKDLSRSELEQLRDNAKRRSILELVTACDAELETRAKPKRTARAPSSKTSGTDVVLGYHFVCQADRGIETNKDGTFWSGSWVVAEKNVRNSLKYGAYLALHASKSETSYRQGRLVDYRKTTRSMVAKKEDGIEFKVQPEDAPYEWVGSGAGEKGYKWSKIVTSVTEGDQVTGK